MRFIPFMRFFVRFGAFMRFGLTAAFILLTCASTGALDWPQWRGPSRDGTGAAFTEPRQWPEKLTERWKITVGTGHASPVLAANRLYVLARQGEEEVVSAIDADTGKTVWQNRYAAPYKMHPAALGHGPGPKSTPLVAEGRVFTLGISGILSALDARTGKLLWRKPAPAVTPLYGTGMSPVIDSGLLIAYVGGHDRGALTAFDPATGAEKWKWTGDGPGYASPIVVTLGGTKQVVTQSQDRIISVDATSGRLLWELPFRTPHQQNIVTPLVYRDTIIYSGLEQGIAAIRPLNRGSSWTLENVWENSAASMYMSSPVLAGDTLYGMSNRNRGHFFALDPRTGKTLWATRGREAENAAIIRAGNLLFVLKDDAELIVARPDPAKFDVIRRYTVAESPTWAHPVIDGARIVVKDAETLTLWSVS
jgi:outer membrane protein assembly factor BamB